MCFPAKKSVTKWKNNNIYLVIILMQATVCAVTYHAKYVHIFSAFLMKLQGMPLYSCCSWKNTEDEVVYRAHHCHPWMKAELWLKSQVENAIIFPYIILCLHSSFASQETLYLSIFLWISFQNIETL